MHKLGYVFFVSGSLFAGVKASSQSPGEQVTDIMKRLYT